MSVRNTIQRRNRDTIAAIISGSETDIMLASRLTGLDVDDIIVQAFKDGLKQMIDEYDIIDGLASEYDGESEEIVNSIERNLRAPSDEVME